MYIFSSSWKKHGTFWWLKSSLSDFVNKPFKHMKLIQCLEVHHQLRAESHQTEEPLFCSVVQSPAGDTANTDPRAAFTALMEFMGGSKPPEFVCWTGVSALSIHWRQAANQVFSRYESSPVPARSQRSVTQTLTGLSNMTPTLSNIKQWFRNMFSTIVTITKLSNNHLFARELFHCS